MRLFLFLFCFPALTWAAPLVPPPGFTQPLPQTLSGKCVTLPAPWTGALEFPSKYAGSDSARATLNPIAERAFRHQTKSIVDFERGISSMVWRYKQSGDPATLNCIITGYRAWADAGALTSAQANHTGRSMRKWALATLASGWIELRSPPGNEQVERWLGQLADRVVNEWDGLPLRKTNNHSYWAAWAVMATAVALDRRDLFDWSVKEYRIAAGQIAADGHLPNEQKRGARALAYHNYALQPLVMIASFAAANGQDVVAENNGALGRLAGYVLSQKQTDPVWLEPWCDITDCDATARALRDASRPLNSRRLGGNLTLIYQR
jgi:poly(beta-D-mannuronate) lyase